MDKNELQEELIRCKEQVECLKNNIADRDRTIWELRAHAKKLEDQRTDLREAILTARQKLDALQIHRKDSPLHILQGVLSDIGTELHWGTMPTANEHGFEVP